MAQCATSVELLAHRGLWTRPEERNTRHALVAAFTAGYGIETDLRDHCSAIVVSHDPATDSAMSFADLLECYQSAGSSATLALNIKADGLTSAVLSLLREFNVDNYFVFDMSVPDTLHWARADARFFTRQSEYEPQPALYEKAQGVWLDAFESNWFTARTIEGHLRSGKEVCVVSPELHRRDRCNVWDLLRQVGQQCQGKLLLCTDLPHLWMERGK
jgi:hypothetical protein